VRRGVRWTPLSSLGLAIYCVVSTMVA
jgi:hypothetical protein